MAAGEPGDSGIHGQLPRSEIFVATVTQYKTSSAGSGIEGGSPPDVAPPELVPFLPASAIKILLLRSVLQEPASVLSHK
jgi:hypothetical protein